MSSVLLHEASLDDLCDEIARRVDASVVMWKRPNEKRSDIADQNYAFSGGIHAAYGLAAELKHRMKLILLADEPNDEAKQ